MRIRNLRASQTAVQAEVVVGQRSNGNIVSTFVKLDRRREDVQQALATLDNLMLREAQQAIDEAVTDTRRRKLDETARPELERPKEVAERKPLTETQVSVDPRIAQRSVVPARVR